MQFPRAFSFENTSLCILFYVCEGIVSLKHLIKSSWLPLEDLCNKVTTDPANFLNHCSFKDNKQPFIMLIKCSSMNRRAGLFAEWKSFIMTEHCSSWTINEPCRFSVFTDKPTEQPANCDNSFILVARARAWFCLLKSHFLIMRMYPLRSGNNQISRVSRFSEEIHN